MNEFKDFGTFMRTNLGYRFSAFLSSQAGSTVNVAYAHLRQSKNRAEFDHAPDALIMEMTEALMPHGGDTWCGQESKSLRLSGGNIVTASNSIALKSIQTVRWIPDGCGNNRSTHFNKTKSFPKFQCVAFVSEKSN